MERVYNKLVRDKIPEIIKAQGDEAVVRVLDEDEYTRCLFDKLSEEFLEFKEDQSIEELCDVLEVIEALKEVLGFSEDVIKETKESKVSKRGAFKEKIFLEKVIVHK